MTQIGTIIGKEINSYKIQKAIGNFGQR